MRRQEDVSAHHHECLEIAVILRGQATHRTTAGETICSPGMVFVIPPGVWHAYAGCEGLEVYNCLLSPKLLGGPLEWALRDPALAPILNPVPWRCSSQVWTHRLSISALGGIRKLLSGLLRTYSKMEVSRRGRLVSDLLLLLDSIALDSVPVDGVPPWEVHWAVRRAAELFREDLARAWCLPELAAELKMNPSYLVRLFRGATGRAPMNYLAEERAHKAAQLLMITDLPLSEIGVRVGWPEPKQFSRSFRQHFGESASRMRRRLKGAAG